MRNLNRTLPLLLLALLAVSRPSGGVAASAASDQRTNSARRVTCSLSNPRYSGWCRVTENLPEGMTGKQVCESVLACLNDVRCSKTYCNATQIRGGWRLEQVDTGSKKN